MSPVDRLDTTGIHEDGTFSRGAESETFDETAVGGEAYERVLDPHPAGSKIGRYVILERVGRGGMGVVYAAFDPELNRRIALKILHAAKSGQGATGHRGGPPRQRLLREAQAIARVSHPNVVSVYDVGTVGESVFVAMEFVDGPTLTMWQAEQRDPSIIVEMYARAARGLAAAHDVGIVHRDFKPDNVLIGADGHARVLDFGLARTDTSVSASGPNAIVGGAMRATPEPEAPSDAVLGAVALDSPLTMDGAVVGTPRFMAPEQHAGVAADARSDQFSFCVALFQALYRQDPFSAPTLERLALAKQAGQIRRPPADARVPPHVEHAILRGLATTPDDRWPDMRALVRAITFDAAAARRRTLRTVLVGGLVASAAAGGVWLARRSTPPSQCSSEERLVGVWDADRRTEIRGVFGAVDVPFAEQAAMQATASLDAYATQWSATYDDACTMHDRGEQSTALFDRRMQCLAQRRQGLAALVDVLARADAGVVQRAGQAASALAPIEPCGDAQYLLEAVEPPPREIEVEVATARELLAEAQALAAAGRTKPALELAVEVVRTAEQLDHGPLLAEALARHGSLLEMFGEYANAEDQLHRALQLAMKHRHDEVAFMASRELASIVGDRLSRHAEGLRWVGLASGLLERMGTEGLALARLDTIEGNIRYRMGDLAAAELAHERALATTERLRGPDDPLVATWLVNLGNVYYQQHRRELTLTTFERAARISEAAYGPSHPSTGFVYFGLANALTALERWDDAEQRILAARKVYRDAYGDTHPVVVACVCNLGVVEEGRKRLGRALERFAECSRLQADVVGRLHPDYSLSLYNLGRLHRETGDLERAREELDEAIAIRDRVLGPEHPQTLEARVARAQVSRAQGDRAAAVRALDEIIGTMAKVGADPLALAGARFEYAQASWELQGPSALAHARAREARATFLADDAPSATALAEVDAWLRDHSEQ